MPSRSALVLATFGTTTEPALGTLLSLRDAMAEAFPGLPLRLAFTSNQIRRIWQRRAVDPDYCTAHPEVPPEIFTVRGVLAAIAELQDQGFDRLLVQSTHIVAAEEFQDLAAYVKGLLSIKTLKPKWQPFQQIALGRPLLGTYDLQRPYSEDILAVARALAADVELARREQAALVYMGHGNPYFPSSGFYLELAAYMRKLYPETLTLIGTIEGFPGLPLVLSELRQARQIKVLLKPFLLLTGEHARKNMAGPEADSWATQLSQAGYTVLPVLRGLAEEPAIVRLLVEHALQAAADSDLLWP